MKVKKFNWFIRLITPAWVRGITLAPFGIYMHPESINNPRSLNEEYIHWAQQMEMLIIGFYIWYGVEWLIKFILPPLGSYDMLGFERECASNRTNLKYLKTRKHFAWFKRIIK